MLPLGFALIAGIVAVNMGITTFRGANRELFMLSTMAMTSGIAALAAVRENNLGLGIGLSILAGIGVGGIVQPAVTMLTIISPDEIIATITSITISIRLVGAAIGYAISFNAYNSQLAKLPTNIATAVTKAGLPLNQTNTFIEALINNKTTVLGSFPASILLVGEEAILDTYLDGFKKVYLVNIAFGVLALIACLFLGNIKKYMVDRVAVDIH